MSAAARNASNRPTPPRRIVGRLDVVDGERPAGEGQHLVERRVGIGLAEKFEARLLELDRRRRRLAEDRAEIGVGGGRADMPSSRYAAAIGSVKSGRRQYSTPLLAVVSNRLAAELLAGEIEEGPGRQQQRRARRA